MDIVQQNTVAARIDRLPLLSLHRKLAFVLGIGTFFDLYDVFLGGLLGTILKPAMHLSALQVSILVSSGFLGMFLGALIIGTVSDYLGRRSMFMFNLLIYSVFSLFVAFSPSYGLIILFRFLSGLGLGAETILADIYISEMVPRYARGRYTAWSYTLGFLGIPMAGLIGKLVVPYSFLTIPGWRWLLVFGAIGAIIVWLLRQGLPESPRWYEIKQRTNEANSAMEKIERLALTERQLTTLPDPETVEVEPQQSRSTLGEIFQGTYAKRTIMLWIFQILQTVGYYGFGTLAPSILTAKGYSVVSTLGYTALIYLGYPLGSLLSIPVVERFERKYLIVIAAAIMAVLGLCFGFATSIVVIVVSGFLMTTVSNFFSNSFHIYQAEIFPTRMRGTAVGIAYSLSRLSNVVLVFVAFPVLASYGAPTIFIGSTVLLAILCLDVIVLGPRTTGRSLEQVAH